MWPWVVKMVYKGNYWHNRVVYVINITKLYKIFKRQKISVKLRMKCMHNNKLYIQKYTTYINILFRQK